MSEHELPRDDEPFDFRRQAAVYARFRRDYTDPLYDAIGARAGRGAGRAAVDLGCGTGFVTASLARRGWRPIGVDLSAPMLGSARAVLPDAALIRGRSEALPLRPATADLVTAGTAFHWMAPAPTLAEVARVLRPGGWMAVFWRITVPDSQAAEVVTDVLAGRGIELPRGFTSDLASPETFTGTALAAESRLRFESTVRLTGEEFAGYMSTVEWIRRIAGQEHAAFLDDLRAHLAAHHPDGIDEHVEEILLLARRA
jgi:trans-aconitate methyltransferase